MRVPACGCAKGRPAAGDHLAIQKRFAGSPATNHDTGKPRRERRHASDMIDMAVRDQHQVERGAVQRPLDRR